MNNPQSPSDNRPPLPDYLVGHPLAHLYNTMPGADLQQIMDAIQPYVDAYETAVRTQADLEFRLRSDGLNAQGYHASEYQKNCVWRQKKERYWWELLFKRLEQLFKNLMIK